MVSLAGRNQGKTKFAMGEVVRVLPREIIVDTLGATGELDGCAFMDQMVTFCGGEFRVRNILTCFYHDDRMWRSPSPLYMLEGLTCIGNLGSLDHRCDRSCFILWHGKWLEKTRGSQKSDEIRQDPLRVAPPVQGEQKSGEACQLQRLCGAGESSFLDRVLEATRSEFRKVKNTVRSFQSDLLGRAHSKKKGLSRKESTGSLISVGDRVRVRPREDIERLVDGGRRYKGVPLMPEIYQYCGMEYKVLKEVSYFYDEVKRKMCKCRDLVILDGVVCHGRKRLYLRRCELNCFIFWHKDFLEKVSPQAP